MARRFLLASVALVLFVGPAGCHSFDTTRRPAPRGTLGEEIVRVFCERMASEANPTDVMGLAWRPVCRGEVPPPADAPPRLAVLMANRTRLARALDRVLPEDAIGDDLGYFMGQLLPLMDDPRERLPGNTRLLAAFLDLLASDAEALDALSAMGTRTGYRPTRVALGMVRPILAYPEFDDFASRALRVLTDRADDPSDGLAADEWRAMGRVLALEMATLAPSDPLPAGEESTLALTRRLMFTRDVAFGAGGSARYVLARDERGVGLPAGGVIAAPFVDMDRDGLADVDTLGRFLDASGAPVDLARPFRVLDEVGIPRDSGGRALRGDGTRIWEYVEADTTLVAGLVREAAPWFAVETPTMLDLARGMPAMLGPDVALTETYGDYTLTYEGPSTPAGSMFDMVYALGEMMHRDETDRALALTEMLLRDHEPEVAAMIDSGRFMLDRSDAYPAARLDQPNVLWDDLLALVVRFSHQPGLVEAFLRAMADPRSARLGEVYGGLMRHRAAIQYDPADINGVPVGFPLDQRVDRAMPDVRGNESLFQRSIALIDGLNGVQVCNRDGAVLRITLLGLPIRWPLVGSARACEIIRIDNVAEAYAEAILGRYELELQSGFLTFMVNTASTLGINVDQALEEASGIRGMTRRPTPQALNRLVFWGLADSSGLRSCTPAADGGDCNSVFAGQLLSPVDDQHGNDVIATYAGTIFAWEQPGFYEGMTPMLEVLHRPAYRLDEDGAYNFGELITTLHRHWATHDHWLTQDVDPRGPNWSYQENGRSYEELVADGFVDGHLLEHMQELNAALDALEVEPGRDGIRVLAEATEALVDPARNPGLRTRTGGSEIPWNDRSRTTPVTPILLLLEGLRAIDRDFASPSGAPRLEPWHDARGRLADQFLGTRRVGEGYVLENQRARAILLAIVPFLRERLADHRARGDLVEWSRGLTGDLEDLMSSPLITALIRFLDRVQDDAEARDALARLVGYLVSEASSNDAFASTLYGAADALFVFDDDAHIVPVMHAMSQALAPNVRDGARRGGRAGRRREHGDRRPDAHPRGAGDG